MLWNISKLYIYFYR